MTTEPLQIRVAALSGEVSNLMRAEAVKAGRCFRCAENRSRTLDHEEPLIRPTHPRNRTCLLAALAPCLLLLAGCGPEPEPPATFHPSTPEEAAALTYFTGTVKPVLRQNCYRCHFGLNHKSAFNLSTRELLLKGGNNGVAVVPGHPESSLLVRLVRHGSGPEHPGPMPPKGRLSDAEITSIEKWIADGAVMDR